MNFTSFLFLTLLIPAVTAAQSLQETVEYINEELRLHTTNWLPQYKSRYAYYDQIELNNEGKLLKSRIEEHKKRKTQNITAVTSGYIKQLEFIEILDNSDEVQDYHILLKVTKGENSIKHVNNNTKNVTYHNEIRFYISNEDIAKRISKAFKHLIALSKENARYLEKDPFSF